MQFHQLKPKHKKKKKKRIGRGGKKGTYSGRGMKGQKSRAGANFKPAIREFVKKYPKLRGYKLNPSKKNLLIVNVGLLEKKFKAESLITPQSLLKENIIRKIKGKLPSVKILGSGDVKKPFTVKNCTVSEQARKKIEKAGGKIL